MNYGTLSDLELVELLQQQDQHAFTEIYERYWAILFLHTKKMLGDEAEASDVIQDIFTSLWTKANQIQIRTCLKAYLYTSVRYKVFTLINRSKLKVAHLNSLSEFMDKGVYSTEDWLTEKELAKSIENQVSLLPPKMRSIFELSRNEHLSYQEIAEKLNVTDHTVRKQISNALKLLRTKFEVFLTLML